LDFIGHWTHWSGVDKIYKLDLLLKLLVNKMEINEDVAELVGIILGDGHIHTKNNLITIVGSIEDLEYFKKRVMPLFELLFNKKPILKRRNDSNAYYLMIYSKEILDFLINEVGLKRGSKEKAHSPKKIISNKKLIPHFLRGLFDTDGCIKFSKQSKDINYYPRIQIALRHSPIAKELKELFKILNFNYGTWNESRFSGITFYQISGNKNTERWFKEISPNNPVHYTKYLFWKKYGYYIPKSTLEFRKSKL
jgi:intein/homing endonuclease